MVLSEILEFLNELAPVALAEPWDNVGLLVGERSRPVARIMTCLTLSPDVAEEAVKDGAGLVVTHHPVLFQPVHQLTGDTAEGRMLLGLIEAGTAVYSPHTGYDSAREGINRQLAELFELSEIEPLRAVAGRAESNTGETAENPGAGRCGRLPEPLTLADFNAVVKQKLAIDALQYVGSETMTIQRVGIACGSAAEFLPDAKAHGCQVLLTGEARFHACLEARALGMAMVLPGHYATERPAVEHLAEILQQNFLDIAVGASRIERDPVKYG